MQDVRTITSFLQHLRDLTAAHTFAVHLCCFMNWTKQAPPKEPLCGIVWIKIKNSEKLARSDSPVGALCTELQKHGGPVARNSRVLFATCLASIETHSRAFGEADGSRQQSVGPLLGLVKMTGWPGQIHHFHPLARRGWTKQLLVEFKQFGV